MCENENTKLMKLWLELENQKEELDKRKAALSQKETKVKDLKEENQQMKSKKPGQEE